MDGTAHPFYKWKYEIGQGISLAAMIGHTSVITRQWEWESNFKIKLCNFFVKNSTLTQNQFISSQVNWEL